MRERRKGKDQDQDQGADELDWERKSEFCFVRGPSSDIHREEEDWELMKAFWVSLSFFAMLLPALACFSKLKRDKRHTYRHAPATIPNKYVFLFFSSPCPVPRFSLYHLLFC
jgi:hypothetical protein